MVIFGLLGDLSRPSARPIATFCIQCNATQQRMLAVTTVYITSGFSCFLGIVSDFRRNRGFFGGSVLLSVCFCFVERLRDVEDVVLGGIILCAVSVLTVSVIYWGDAT